MYQHEERRNFNLLETALHPIVAYNVIMKAKHAHMGAIPRIFAKLVPNTRMALPQHKRHYLYWFLDWDFMSNWIFRFIH